MIITKNYAEARYSVQYFIEKFEAIPEEQWCTDMYHSPDNTQHCSLGHCKDRDDFASEEGSALYCLFHPAKNIVHINDNEDNQYKQSTPKQRVLAALTDLAALAGENSKGNQDD